MPYVIVSWSSEQDDGTSGDHGTSICADCEYWCTLYIDVKMKSSNNVNSNYLIQYSFL